MVDNATITLNYRGRKVKAAPVTSEQASALSLVRTAGESAQVRVLGAVLGTALGSVWDDVLTDMAMGHLSQNQLNKLLMDLVKKSAAWYKANDPYAPDYDGDDAPVDDDDAEG